MKDNKTRIIKLSQEDITAYNFGEYNSYNNRWVDYGKDNDYPSFLRSLYLSSPTHQAICDGVVNMATGEGVELTDPINNPISNTFITKNFPTDVVKKMIGDLKIYGFYALRIYDNSMVEYSEAIKYRFSPNGRNTCWFSNDWENYNYKVNKPVELPLYSNDKEVNLSVMFVQLDKKGFNVYSPVDYNGAINYISLEQEISIYHLSNIKNGLFPSFVIDFVGTEYSDEQMNEVEKSVNKKFGGSGNTGKAIIGFPDSKDNSTTITTIDQPNIDQTYTFLSKECSEKIMIGHGITSPLLFGLRDTGGGLGSNSDELKQAFYLFYENKLKHYQNYIIYGIEKLMHYNYLYAEVKFKTYNPFAVTDNTQQLSKYDRMDEIKSSNIIKSIEKLKKEPTTILGENIFDGVQKENVQYKFMRSSNNENMVIKKLELLSKKGFVFDYDPNIIKNTEDYYFLEQYTIKK